MDTASSVPFNSYSFDVGWIASFSDPEFDSAGGVACSFASDSTSISMGLPVGTTEPAGSNCRVMTSTKP